MKWAETTASKCRYGSIAGRIFGDAEIVWENSLDDWQGFANVLAKLPGGTFAHYEWSYGSCSGCDEWEAAGLSDDEIEAAMREAMAAFPDRAMLRRYLHLEDLSARYPTANSPDNGSLPGMIRNIFGGIGEDFRAMAQAFDKWDKDNPDEHRE